MDLSDRILSPYHELLLCRQRNAFEKALMHLLTALRDSVFSHCPVLKLCDRNSSSDLSLLRLRVLRIFRQTYRCTYETLMAKRFGLYNEAEMRSDECSSHSYTPDAPVGYLSASFLRLLQRKAIDYSSGWRYMAVHGPAAFCEHYYATVDSSPFNNEDVQCKQWAAQYEMELKSRCLNASSARSQAQSAVPSFVLRQYVHPQRFR